MKTWIARVQHNYASLDELRAFDTQFGIARRCGYSSVEQLWRCNPLIGGSVHPADFGRVKPSEARKFTKRGRVRHRLAKYRK